MHKEKTQAMLEGIKTKRGPYESTSRPKKGPGSHIKLN